MTKKYKPTKLGIRLRKARDLRDLTQKELATAVGIKQQAVQRIEAGAVKSSTFLVQMANKLGVSPTWLATGPGDEPVLSESDAVFHRVAEDSAQYRADFSAVPLVTWPQLSQLHQVLSKGMLPLIPCSVKLSEKSVALSVLEDSMTQQDGTKMSFLRHDIVIVDLNKLPVDGNYVLAKVKDQFALRQYFKDDNSSYLKPLNHKYESVTCHGANHVMGVVVQRITNLN